MTYYVYIMANNTNTVLYTGVTSNLIRRVYEHRQEADPKSLPRNTMFIVWYILKKPVTCGQLNEKNRSRAGIEQERIN